MFKMVIICCVCKCVIGYKNTEREEDNGKETHTYCSKCYDDFLLGIDNWK